MKFSNPRYPVQFWSEIVAGIVGKHTGVPVPSCYISSDPKTGQLGSLASWFYGKGAEDDFEELTTNDEGENSELEIAPLPLPDEEVDQAFSRYVPGSSYMVRFIPGYDLEKGKQHNLKTLSRLLTALRMRHSVNYWPHWSGILTFDAIIGNTDRHQDNWGLLWRRDADNNLIPRFSPAFDNGTSLLHEIMEEKLELFSETDRRKAYIRRGRHHLRSEMDSAQKFRHLELIQQILDTRPELSTFVKSVTNIDFLAMGDEIRALSQIDCITPISNARCEAIIKVVEDRVAQIQEMIDND